MGRMGRMGRAPLHHRQSRPSPKLSSQKLRSPKLHPLSLPQLKPSRMVPHRSQKHLLLSRRKRRRLQQKLQPRHHSRNKVEPLGAMFWDQEVTTNGYHCGTLAWKHLNNLVYDMLAVGVFLRLHTGDDLARCFYYERSIACMIDEKRRYSLYDTNNNSYVLQSIFLLIELYLTQRT